MGVFNGMSNFLSNVFKRSKEDNPIKQLEAQELEKMAQNVEKLDEQLEISTKSIVTKLYSLNQIVNILKTDYPEKYQFFIEKINVLRTDYLKSLEESEKSLTFEIDPNRDIQKISEVIALEKKIKDFIDIDMKYDTIAKKVQKFILKLNILYNTTIFYPNEKEKVLKQLEQGFITEERLTKEFIEWAKIPERELEKERMYLLFSYSEYVMFKIYIRNSHYFNPENYNFTISKTLKSDNLFSNFKDYMLDEISDTAEFLDKIKDEIFLSSYNKRINDLNKLIVSKRNEKDIIFNQEIWDEMLKLEDEILSRIIENNGGNKEEAQIKVLDKLNISVKENEIYTVPKNATILNLAGIYYGSIKNDALVIMRFLQTLSDNITYKDIYFLIVLFDMLQDIKEKCKELYKNIEKYDLRYNYTQEEMNRKKKLVLESSTKEYILVFKINDFEENSIDKYLKKYNIDYYIKDNQVFMNKVYFNDLENIKKELEENSKK